MQAGKPLAALTAGVFSITIGVMGVPTGLSDTTTTVAEIALLTCGAGLTFTGLGLTFLLIVRPEQHVHAPTHEPAAEEPTEAGATTPEW